MSREPTVRPVNGELWAQCLEVTRRRIGPKLHPFLSAEDIVQASIAQVLAQEARSISGESTLTPEHVLAVAELRVRGEARRAGRELPAGVPRGLDGAALPEEALGQREAHDLLRRELSRLRPDHRWVLILRTWLKASWETVAFVLEMPSREAARCLHKRALRALAVCITRESSECEYRSRG